MQKRNYRSLLLELTGVPNISYELNVKIVAGAHLASVTAQDQKAVTRIHEFWSTTPQHQGVFFSVVLAVQTVPLDIDRCPCSCIYKLAYQSDNFNACAKADDSC